jgi:hypothetical protein
LPYARDAQPSVAPEIGFDLTRKSVRQANTLEVFHMLALMIAVALASAPAQQDASVPALTNAEDCLRANVMAAVDSNTNAIDAADFLLTYLCAAPVRTAARYELNLELLNTSKIMAAGWPSTTGLPADEREDAPASDERRPNDNPFSAIANAPLDPVTGEIVVSEASSSMMINMLRNQSSAFEQLEGEPKPTFLRELAGRLVLEAQRR